MGRRPGWDRQAVKYEIIYHPVATKYADLDPLTDPSDTAVLQPSVGVKVTDDAGKHQWGAWTRLPTLHTQMAVLTRIAILCDRLALHPDRYELGEGVWPREEVIG